MRVFLLLAACFCEGLSYDEEVYGNPLKMKLHRRAQSIEFTPEYSSDVMVLWKRDDPVREDSRGKVVGSNYVINNLTQEDSGRYIMRDKSMMALHVKSIHVKASRKSYEKKIGEDIRFISNLEPNSCNIYFIPESDQQRETEIVRNGRLDYSHELDCEGFYLLKPCGISIEDLQMSCSGSFVVRDSNGNTALSVLLEMESFSYDTSKIGIGIGISLAVLSCCVCVRRCCCGKSSSKKNQSETPDAEPAVHYHEYDNEPVGRRPEQLGPPSGTRYPSRASYTPTGPLIHNPPSNVPPAYSEVSAPTDAPTAPGHSEPEPRFELKGMNFPSFHPLSSDSTCNDVYTSDKLNFI